jgi:hypothetical protein
MGNIYAQIEYSEEHENWILPRTYYGKEFELAGQAGVQFLFLDTSPFHEEYRSNPDHYPNLMKQDRDAQIRWLKNTLDKTDATWRIAIGHHPLYTAGPHDDTEELKKILPELF